MIVVKFCAGLPVVFEDTVTGLRRTALRLVPVYALVCGLGVAIGAYLDFVALRSAYLDVVRTRFTALAGQVVTNAETSLTLRTPLAEQETLVAFAQREQGLDPLILSIDIADANEIILLSTQAARAGSKIAVSADALLLREPIRDDIARTVGHVAIRYDARRVGETVDRLWSDMLQIALPVALIAVLVGSLLSGLLLNRLAKRIETAGDPGRWRGEAARARDAVLSACLAIARRLGGDLPEVVAQRATRRPAQSRLSMPRADGLRPALAALVVAILTLALLTIGVRMAVTGTQVLVPELERNARSVARSVGATIERAIDYGIPANAIPGLDRYLADQLGANRDLGAIRYRTGDGRVLGEAIGPGRKPGAWLDDPSGAEVPVRQQGTAIGGVIVAVPPDIVESKMQSVWLDQAIVVFVATLIALELLALAVGQRELRGLADLEARLGRLRRGRFEIVASLPSGGGIDALAARVDAALDSVAAVYRRVLDEAKQRGDAAAMAQLSALTERYGVGERHPAPEPDRSGLVRPALFLFMLSEELTRPLLPSHVRTFDLTALGVAPDLALSLPIIVFMAVMALSQPLLGPSSDRIAPRRLFLIGAALGAAGHAAAALAPDYWSFVAARGTTAVGYALVFVSTQAYMIAHAPASERANALAVFVRAIMVAALCGPPIGGIIADRLGSEATFTVAAFVAAASGLVAFRLLQGSPGPRPATGQSVARPAVLLRSPLLLAVLVGCALPAKIVLAALCFYLVPLELARAGYDLAEIGRLQMLYPIVMVICVPVFAMLADRWNARAAFVVAGGLVAGLASLYPSALDAPWVIALMLVQLGVGQALSIAPQSALVADLGQRLTGNASTGFVMGFFRFVERLGNAAGPAIAAVLLAGLGFAGTLGAIGGIVIAGALVVLAVLLSSRRSTRHASLPERRPAP